MKHSMNLQQRFFGYIKNGTKRIELRLFDEKRQKIKVGDTIEFSSPEGESFEAEVVELLHYDSFEKLFADYDISILADKSMTKKELLNILQEFYTPEKQAEYGVVGIWVKLLEK